MKNITESALQKPKKTVKYVYSKDYDARGNATIYKVTQINGEDVYTELAANEEHIGNINPIRYRGYYYDADMGLYYLQSRYYDPEIGRFISADDPEILFEDQDNILENNLYTYCFTNPENMADPNGRFARYASRAAVYGGFALGGVYYSCKLINKGISYFQEHRTTKNGSKKKKGWKSRK